MWSLPDIKRMNEDAKAFEATLKRIVVTGKDNAGKKLRCEHHSRSCEGAVRAIEYYDIFSDTPKGYIPLCEKHNGYYGTPDEGYFTCDACGRVFIENYTWEAYFRVGEGEILCLNCYREQELAKPENWIELTAENIAKVDFEQIRKAKHLLASGQAVPNGLKFIDNAEFDSMSGQQISGPTIKEILTAARDAGYKRAILILDAAYQFAVSIGVYVENGGHNE